MRLHFRLGKVIWFVIRNGRIVYIVDNFKNKLRELIQ